MKQKTMILLLLFSLLSAFFPTIHARADVAPPQMPPGATLNPGEEVTQVRMMAETVVLNVRQDPQQEEGAIADTAATFIMRNLGASEETMQARFPLSFAGGDSDGFGNFPEIAQITVKVNGKSAAAKREMQPAFAKDSSYQERADVPWAVFSVTFPPGQDVTIEVAYTVSGFGYYPYEAFQYILETGAGWNDTIGSADIVVRLPYEANRYNLWLPNETTGYSQTSPGAVLSGNELLWHFDNLEPTAESNIEVSVVSPVLWQKVLNETQTVTRNPNDGEAWGRLGKAYKEIAIMPKHGDPRMDADGRELYGLSKQAYEKCLSLLPNDSLWHFGYADLLWSHFYFDVYMAGKDDAESLLPRILTELKTALELDPNNSRAKDLLSWISSSVPGAVQINGSNYEYLALTATPIPPTPYLFVTETPISTPTLPAIASATSAPTLPPPLPTASATGQPAGSPICGAAWMVPLLVGGVWWSRRRTLQ